MKLSYGAFNKPYLEMLSEVGVLKLFLMRVDNKRTYLGTTATEVMATNYSSVI